MLYFIRLPGMKSLSVCSQFSFFAIISAFEKLWLPASSTKQEVAKEAQDLGADSSRGGHGNPGAVFPLGVQMRPP